DQHQRGDEQRQRRQAADDGLGVAHPFVEQQHERGGQDRHDDRQDRQMRAQVDELAADGAAQTTDPTGPEERTAEFADHWLVSSPSTWSVPVKPRAASSTTRNNAVIEKLMTMEVSTSDCGTGS